MRFKEFLRRMNHRQSLENSICDESCLSCEHFEECLEESRNDEEWIYSEVPMKVTRFSFIFGLLSFASFVGIGIYGIIEIVKFFI